MPPGNRKILSVVALTLLIAGVLAFRAPAHIGGTVRDSLVRAGFADASLPKPDVSLLHKTSFDAIVLDQDKFSTIERITIDTGLLDAMTAPQNMSVDRMLLTGEFGNLAGLSIAGWTPPRISVPLTDILPETGNLSFNDFRLDLDTPAGAIRLEGNARITRKDDGSRSVEASVGGKQQQATFDTRWTAVLSETGKWSATTEIVEARIDIDSFAASRISGWLNIEQGDEKMLLPLISGQIAAGQVRLGPNTALTNVSMAAENPKEGGHHFILQGNSSGSISGVTLSADIVTDGDGRTQLTASLSAPKFDALLTFLENLKRDTDDVPLQSAFLTTLMLTPGNLERIRKSAEGQDYDKAELIVSGAPFDLTGKIVLSNSTGETTQKQVISLNPASP